MLAIVGVTLSILLLVATFHPQLGPRVYGRHWPSALADPRQRPLATVQSVLLSVCVGCLAFNAWFASFRSDAWTIRGVMLLGVAVVCGCIGLGLGLLRLFVQSRAFRA